ncbi:flavin reductase family protein [Streptomyces mangrovi]|uniref:flavin reductase family protein n=1 Tax=Streptomyces mangrovi TaxID=1206892 RepID=UPI00399D548F
MSTTARPLTGPAAVREAADVPSRLRRRRALYRLASPVSVLTVRHAERPHGTTVSNIGTVSREPLLLGACLRSGSLLAELAAAEGRFTVNVLDASQTDMARYFADPDRPDGEAQFAHWPWTTDPYTRAPRLEGGLAHYACRVFGRPRIGDHEVLLGHVTRTAVGEGEPLLSYAGGLFTGRLSPVPETGPDHRTGKESTT